MALVGESGSGKTTLAESIMGLNRGDRAVNTIGTVMFRGRDLVAMTEAQLRRSVWGVAISMIFQDPMSSLNPVQRIGWQIAEMLTTHGLSWRQANHEAIRLLGEVGIPNPVQRVNDYPHQFSGGMRQRAMIALALACNPALLIADEPTTALDVTIQAQILDLLKRLRSTHRSSILLVSHDLGAVADIADRVMVMYAGQIVEVATADQLFRNPQHPYSWGLLASVPRLDRTVERLLPIPGVPATMTELKSGCPFRERCRYAMEICAQPPELLPTPGEGGHLSRCWLSESDRVRLRGKAESE
jgi:oligopeptide/dipeptide ABC transporter ATP-binding protein